MSRSFGTGSPNFFRCARCRKAPGARENRRGWKYVATGKARYQRPHRGSAPGTRSNSTTAFEYRCSDCGHVGWSRHTDVERLFIGLRT